MDANLKLPLSYRRKKCFCPKECTFWISKEEREQMKEAKRGVNTIISLKDWFVAKILLLLISGSSNKLLLQFLRPYILCSTFQSLSILYLPRMPAFHWERRLFPKIFPPWCWIKLELLKCFYLDFFLPLLPYQHSPHYIRNRRYNQFEKRAMQCETILLR